MKRWIWVPVGIILVVSLLVLLLARGHGLPQPMGEGFINSTFGPGEVLPTSGYLSVSQGQLVVHEVRGDSVNTTPALLGVIYQAYMINRGYVEYVNGSDYHFYLVVLLLNPSQVVSSNYTQVMNETNTTLIIVHRGFAEADFTFYGHQLSLAQEMEVVSYLSGYLERVQSTL
ncbi:hypothetical protein GWK48_02640 [Metallosphaera tengchongensis]|uniref:Uncharacterized protein n=1 Tax=Metallosphaera tengchongensis TaxID=1532350 RepID=A0A6N0NTC1_9CREN|nr:hypothetical protein [Metallosphaera tengchongensis]QKQ99434.1 hypothetical protein GWK48_02640 [Metallosphaera tengchongensis]